MLVRILKHLFTDHAAARRAFPAPALRAITDAVALGETRHDGELRFVIEASLPLRHLWRHTMAHQRALEVFSQLRVWDTEHNSGVLIYVLLADRHVEIVADRGINAKMDDAAWQVIVKQMQNEFAAGRFEQGAVAGIKAISDLLALHFPPGTSNPNELPDEPVML
jgi:uncharacterized membrane protein